MPWSRVDRSLGQYFIYIYIYFFCTAWILGSILGSISYSVSHNLGPRVDPRFSIVFRITWFPGSLKYARLLWHIGPRYGTTQKLSIIIIIIIIIIIWWLFRVPERLHTLSPAPSLDKLAVGWGRRFSMSEPGFKSATAWFRVQCRNHSANAVTTQPLENKLSADERESRINCGDVYFWNKSARSPVRYVRGVDEQGRRNGKKDEQR